MHGKYAALGATAASFEVLISADKGELLRKVRALHGRQQRTPNVCVKLRVTDRLSLGVLADLLQSLSTKVGTVLGPACLPYFVLVPH